MAAAYPDVEAPDREPVESNVGNRRRTGRRDRRARVAVTGTWKLETERKR
jgi:hypothetical protein